MSPDAARNVAWSGVEAAVGGVLSFASAVVVARLVGPSELGFGAAVVAVHVLLWVVVNALFADALVQRGATDAATLASAFWASVAAGILAALLQVAAGRMLAAWLHDPRLLPMCALLALPLPLVGAAGVAQGLLTLRRDYRALAWRTIVGQGLGTVLAVAAARAHAGAWALVLQQFTISAGGAATLLAAAGLRSHAAAYWPLARATPHWPVVRALLGVGLPLTAGTLVLTGRYRVFALLIGGTAGPSILGQVHMAFRMVETVRDLASTAQWRLMLPFLAERKHDPPALLAACDRLLRLSSRVMLPVCGTMLLAMPPLVRLVLGPAWTASAHAGVPLIALMALLMLGFPAGVALVARGRTGQALTGHALATSATLLAVLLLRPATPLAAALLWVAAQMAVMPYNLRVNGRALGIGPLRPLRGGLGALGVTLAALGAALLVREGGSMAWLAVERLAVFSAIVGAHAAWTSGGFRRRTPGSAAQAS